LRAWPDASWRPGTFALPAVAAGLWILASISRSRALAVITLIYTAVVCLAGWLDLQQVIGLPAFLPLRRSRGPAARGSPVAGSLGDDGGRPARAALSPNRIRPGSL